MLTREDLESIRLIFKEEIKREVRITLRDELSIHIGPIQDRLDGIESHLNAVNKRLDTVDARIYLLERRVTFCQKEVESVKRRLTRIRKDISYIVRTYDEDIKSIRVRTDRIEKHLHLKN